MFLVLNSGNGLNSNVCFFKRELFGATFFFCLFKLFFFFLKIFLELVFFLGFFFSLYWRRLSLRRFFLRRLFTGVFVNVAFGSTSTGHISSIQIPVAICSDAFLCICHLWSVYRNKPILP